MVFLDSPGDVDADEFAHGDVLIPRDPAKGRDVRVINRDAEDLAGAGGAALDFLVAALNHTSRPSCEPYQNGGGAASTNGEGLPPLSTGWAD